MARCCRGGSSSGGGSSAGGGVFSNGVPPNITTGATASLTDPNTGTTTPPIIPSIFTPAAVVQSHPLNAQPATNPDFLTGAGIGVAGGVAIAAIAWFFFLRK